MGTPQSDTKGESRKPPSAGSFWLLIVTLWALNLADIYQTIGLKEAGFLGLEANYFVDFFLRQGNAPFFFAKLLALILITSILVRGWFDSDGIRFLKAKYTQEQVQGAISFLLIAGVCYYVVIVGFPFIALLASGMFTT